MRDSIFNSTWFQISEEDIETMEEMIGKKTINQFRAEAGMPLVSGGDQPYTDWLRDVMGYKKQLVH